MPYETDFDTAFTILLGKAQNTIAPTPAPVPSPGTGGGGGSTAPAIATSYVIAFQFSGGLTAVPALAEVPDPGEIVWVHVYAGGTSAEPVAVTATIDLQLTRWETFGGTTPIYGSGTPPRLQADSISNTSLSGWLTHLSAGDALVGRMTEFEGDANSWVAMMLRVRRDIVVQNQTSLIDDTGAVVTDPSGNVVIFRT